MTNEYYFQRTFRRWLFLGVFLLLGQLFLLQASAVSFGDNVEESPEFLPVHEAFQFSGNVEANHKAIIHIKVAEGYYLYKARLRFHANDTHTRVGEPLFPTGIEILDPFQNQEMIVFPKSTSITLPYTTTSKNPELKIEFQGCARAGLCYPPTETTIHLTHLALKVKTNDHTQITTPSKVNKTLTHQALSHRVENNKYFNLLNQHNNWFVVFGLFFIAGILLAFTPCVLPMVPILSATLAGSVGNRRRTIMLTIAYIVSMSITYAIAGSLVGLFGATLNLQALLQSPWVIGLFALLFVVLAFSMFGIYELQMPAKLRHYILSADASTAKKRKGSLLGAGFMGVCSALVVSPCVTAPLVGALLYISSTQNALLGGLVLFSLGLGMGVPLFVVGVGFGQWLPKSGIWMEKVKYAFGFLMLGVALWLISRVIPGHIVLILWGIFSLSVAGFSVGSITWNALSSLRRKLFIGVTGLVLSIYGISLIVGGLMGNTSFTTPLAMQEVRTFEAGNEVHIQKTAEFIRVTSPLALQQLQMHAVKEHRPLILDFYANWCESCKQMDHNVFEKPEMAPLLSKFMLVRFDITKTTSKQLKMMKRMQVFGAPTIVLYNAEGKEVKRQVGEASLDEFRQLLHEVLNENNKGS